LIQKYEKSLGLEIKSLALVLKIMEVLVLRSKVLVLIKGLGLGNKVLFTSLVSKDQDYIHYITGYHAGFYSIRLHCNLSSSSSLFGMHHQCV